MATLRELVAAKVLREHFPDLESWEMPERHMYCSPQFDASLAKLKEAARVRGRNLPPFEQVEQLFYEYVIGRPMTYSVGYRVLEPSGLYVWEFRPPDVRIFGWFPRKRHFIATDCELKNNLSKEKQNKSTNALYQPFINDAASYRAHLPLDEPKLVQSTHYHDIL